MATPTSAVTGADSVDAGTFRMPSASFGLPGFAPGCWTSRSFSACAVSGPHTGACRINSISALVGLRGLRTRLRGVRVGDFFGDFAMGGYLSKVSARRFSPPVHFEAHAIDAHVTFGGDGVEVKISHLSGPAGMRRRLSVRRIEATTPSR